MDIFITEWGLQSYLALLNKAFNLNDYKTILRPDIKMLNSFPDATKFRNSKFWGPATVRGNRVPRGFKMKWHNIGPGRVQLRLPVAIVDDKAFLCEAYVKTSQARDRRAMAKFQAHIEMIEQGLHESRGVL